MTVFPHPKAPKIHVKIVISMLCHIYYFDFYCGNPEASNSKKSFTWNGSGSTLYGWKQSIEYSLSGKQRMIRWQFLGTWSRLTYGPYLYEQQNRQNYTVELLQFVNDNTYKLMIIWKYVTCISVYSVFSPSNSVSRILSLMVQLPAGARYVTVPLAFGGSKTLNDDNVTMNNFEPSKNYI